MTSMTETIHAPATITGYRTLTPAEVTLINAIKAQAELVGETVAQVAALAGTDPRWAAIAKTELQQGFMALIRSVARPTTF